jgi:hypothetical protein
MTADNNLRKIADEISRKVAELRAARKPLPRPHSGGWHKGALNEPYKWPQDPYSFIRSGGMYRAEAVAISKAIAAATKEARRHVRQYWLPILQQWLELEPEGIVRQQLVHEVKRLRRLSRSPSPATVRKQTRERVRAFRERQRTAQTKDPARAETAQTRTALGRREH